MIHVVIPHYRATHWLLPNLWNLRALAAAPDQLAIDVLTMEADPAEREAVRAVVGAMATVTDFPQPGKIGGQPLPAVLTAGVQRLLEAELTVTVDPDAIVVRRHWDRELVTLFAQSPCLICAGINPRSDFPDFAGVPEWNWMAFRTAYWARYIAHFQARRIDIGHLFKDATAHFGGCCHTWPLLSRPFAGKLASIAGDAAGPWAVHAYYSTRRREDVIPAGEHASILTPQQEQELITWASARSVS